MKQKIDYTESGYPILLAVRAPGQVAAQPDPSGITQQRSTSSGNPWSDPKTGRFTNAPPGMRIYAGEDIFKTLTNAARQYIQQQLEAVNADGIGAFPAGNNASIVLFQGEGRTRVRAFVVPTEDSDPEFIDQFESQFAPEETGTLGPLMKLPQGVTQEEWDRRVDAVRDAARTLLEIDEAKATEFLEKRRADLTKVDINAFIADVREARLDDLVDVLHNQLKNLVERAVEIRNGIKVTAPKGFTNKTLRGLTDDEVVRVLKRLEGRGFDPEELKKHVISRINDESRQAVIAQLYGEPKPKEGESSG